MQFRHGAYYYVVAGKWHPLGKDLGEALRQWAEHEGTRVQTGRTVAHAIAYYLSAKAFAPRTLEGYRISETRIAGKFGGLPLDELRPEMVTRHLRTAEHKVAANRDKALLSAAYRWVNAEGWLRVVGYNPAAVPRNPEKARRRYVTDVELGALLDKAGPKLACMIELAYITGIRKGDLLKLRLADAQEDGLHVTQGKTGHRQVFVWTDDLRRLVATAKGLRRKVGSLWLFPAERDAGEAMSALALRTAWERARKAAGLPDVRWHDLRRKAGSDAAQAEAQALLGHADGRITSRHYRAAPVEVRPLSRRPLPKNTGN
jgi:integrase